MSATDGGSLSFLTPYWSGRQMMEIHLASIRQYHPDAPILISKRGGEREEMEAHRRVHGVQYWLEECAYIDAYFRLLDRCRTRYICIIDHDTVLLHTLRPLLDELAASRADLVGVEERIVVPPFVTAQGLIPGQLGWWRLAPGQVDSNFLMLDWGAFRARWGLRGVIGSRGRGLSHEIGHGISQRLSRHHYLRPWHVPRYGAGNLLQDAGVAYVWHQWFGAYRTRLADADEVELNGGRAMADGLAVGEANFVADFPALRLEGALPGWGEGREAEIERVLARPLPERELRARVVGILERLRGWRRYGMGGILTRIAGRLDRWWRQARDPFVRGRIPR